MVRQVMTVAAVLFCNLTFSQNTSNRYSEFPDSVATHKVVLDSASKIVSWIQPQSNAYDRFLRDRWNFIIRGVPNAPNTSYPQYYFYCAYKDQQMIPDTWMNDVGEKIPNWFESARLYYQYTGDKRVMDIVSNFVIYTLSHGTSPASSAWPNFPYTTTNAGDTVFKGFTGSKKLVEHEIQVDHAADIGFTYYKLYLYTRNDTFKRAAIQVADVLAAHARTGSATQSVWPYRVVMTDGRVTAEYGANWTGACSLLTSLIQANLGDLPAYRSALKKARDFILQFPMKTGYWTDGHTDTDVRSFTYKSNMSASNAVLYMFDHPDFDPHFMLDIPKLIHWTETNFVLRTAKGEPSRQWGANIVGEQDEFLPKMDYQTARYGAECAKWFASSGDASYKEKAYRALNWVTYCSDSAGLAFESPLSNGVTSWWSDCYGEGPRMFYFALSAVPEWAPKEENHILYSTKILGQVNYDKNKLTYMSTERNNIQYLRVSFKPSKVMVNGKTIPKTTRSSTDSYSIRPLTQGDFALTIKTSSAGTVSIQ